MSAPEQLFFQSIKVAGGKELPIFNLVSGAYTEEIQLNGPIILLTFTDIDSALADDLGVREGAVLDVRMGDAGNKSRAVYFASTFSVISAEPKGDHLLITAIEKGAFDIKQPVTFTKVFADTTAEELLAELFPNHKVEVSPGVPKERFTYHIPAASTASLMLRQFARDWGCAIWIARGWVYCFTYKELLTRIPKDGPIRLEYQGDVQQRIYAVYSYSPIYVSERGVREKRRQFMTWDTERGLLVGQINEGCPRVFLPAVHPNALDTAVWRFTSCMQAELNGSGVFSAGFSATVRLNRMSKESVIDESVPLKQVFGRISHIQNPHSYHCVATMGVPEC